MGLFSFFRKDRQQSSASDSDFYSRADEEQTGRPKRKNKRDDPVDPVLPEKKRARRRLVGAVALVLAAVIGLPMILDSEPKPLSDDISIQIPSKDASSTMPQPAKAAAPAAPATDSARASLDEAEEVITPPPAVKSDKPSTTASAPVSVPAPTPVPAPVKPPVVAKVEPVPAKPQQPPAIDKNDTSVEAARARAILEGRPADKPAIAKPAPAATNGKISLQVAALASQDKVNELQKKLQSAGLKTYTQKVATASGDRIRVRVGPFANEAEAEKARAKLSSIGLTGTIAAH